jgi:hypothetical protein
MPLARASCELSPRAMAADSTARLATWGDPGTACGAALCAVGPMERGRITGASPSTLGPLRVSPVGDVPLCPGTRSIAFSCSNWALSVIAWSSLREHTCQCGLGDAVIEVGDVQLRPSTPPHLGVASQGRSASS